MFKKCFGLTEIRTLDLEHNQVFEKLNHSGMIDDLLRAPSKKKDLIRICAVVLQNVFEIVNFARLSSLHLCLILLSFPLKYCVKNRTFFFKIEIANMSATFIFRKTQCFF